MRNKFYKPFQLSVIYLAAGCDDKRRRRNSALDLCTVWAFILPTNRNNGCFGLRHTRKVRQTEQTDSRGQRTFTPYVTIAALTPISCVPEFLKLGTNCA